MSIKSSVAKAICYLKATFKRYYEACLNRYWNSSTRAQNWFLNTRFITNYADTRLYH